MSVATRPPPALQDLPAPSSAPLPASLPERPDSLVLRLVAFAALAAWATGHWAGLVVHPGGLRMTAVVLVAVGTAATLGLLGRLASSLGATVALAAIVTLAGLVAGLLVAGLPARLLPPAGLGDLGAGVNRGLSGLRSASWPYDGPDAWVRQVLLIGLPLFLGLAAAVGFWPSRRRSAPRLPALALLLLVYGIAVANRDPGQPLLRGLVLLALVAAWLWLPRLRPREAGKGALLVLAAGLCSLPLAARFDGDGPWWNYRHWHWFGGGTRVVFDWTHSYGPLEWPRKGTTLLYVKAPRPEYWKAETLDRFDGFRWLHSNANDARSPSTELPAAASPRGRRWSYFRYNPRWKERIRFTVNSLTSEVVVGAGTTQDVSGAGGVTTSADGTTLSLQEEPLQQGDSYVVQAYVPHPSPEQMRAAPRGFPPDLREYTQVYLPSRGDSAQAAPPVGNAVRQSRPPRRLVVVPLRGEPLTGSRGADRALNASPYGRTYRLALRITAGASSSYAAVRAVDRYLQRHFTYGENTPQHDFPLDAFLFKDRFGYCQQFSGAMALMLRMAGIPARVAAGFTPGSFNRDTHEWRVRDLDAHSWVEVYFNGIGWVRFDPTPPAAPAESQSSGVDAPNLADASVLPRAGKIDGGAGPKRSPHGGRTRSSGGGLPWWVAVLGSAALLTVVVTALSLGRLAARRRGAGQELLEAQIAELQAALQRLGLAVPPGTTLLALERRLDRLAGPAAARYAAALRTARFSAAGATLPRPADRRALRRALTAGRNPLLRLRGLLALPPAPFIRP